MSRIVIGAKIDVKKGTPKRRSRKRVPDSFHFSFNRIVTVVFVVNIVVLLCKYNINSDADKRFGNAIKNEKRRFFLFLLRFLPQIYHGRHLTFVAPLGILYIYVCATAYIFNGTARIYSRPEDYRKRRKTRSVTSTLGKRLSSRFFNACFRLAPSVRLKRVFWVNKNNTKFH